MFAVGVSFLLLDTVVEKNQLIYAVVGSLFIAIFYFFLKENKLHRLFHFRW
ncbi:hypothetical protein B4135_0664 [Caldibacillus debilis]|uniref:Uncharacterized protein n=1 Tax=Caldibacillus debilis TaxID=301148 RepID=A0A150LZA1_9BACI|nr:hypothetical protein B4135_0664 [Caldibacillus debilis]